MKTQLKNHKILIFAIALALITAMSVPISSQANSKEDESIYHDADYGAALIASYDDGTYLSDPFILESDFRSAKEDAVMYLNETYRIPAGLQPVELDENLCKYADLRAKENFFNIYINGDNIYPHLNTAGTYTCFLSPKDSAIEHAGENLLVEYVYVEDDWDNSTIENALKDQFVNYSFSEKGHYECMMYPSDNHCGIGFYIVPNANVAFIAYIGTNY